MSKHIVITGGTSGIGQAAVESLAQDQWDVTILARSLEKVDKLQSRFPEASITGIACDLTDLSSVKKSADEVLKLSKKIDVLMNNAGGIFQQHEETGDGFEMTFQVNHLSHFLLTTALMDQLIADQSRVVSVSSAAHRLGKLNFEDLQWQHTKYNAMKAYGNGKLCNIYFTQELHRRFNSEGIRSYACHPGVVNTNFASESNGFFKVLMKVAKPLMISPEKGAQTQLYLATSDEVKRHSGRYFEKQKLASIASQARDEEAAAQLWEISEQLVENFR